MKQFPARPRWSTLSSFTLIELLVVIAIIAILASVILYAGGQAIRSAKQAKAANIATQIQTAALGYYTEYSVYPVPGGTTTDYTIADLSANQSAWGNLICSLCGNIQPYAPATAFTVTSSTPTNSRSIAFLSLRGSDVDSGNAPLNPVQTGTEIYFNIAIDSDYDGLLGTTAPTKTVMPNFATASGNTLSSSGGTSTAGVAVWANCTGKTTLTNAAWWVHTY